MQCICRSIHNVYQLIYFFFFFFFFRLNRCIWTHCAFKCTAFTSNFKLLAKLSHVIVHIFMLSFRLSAWKPRSWFALLKRLHSNRKENMENTMYAICDITLTGRYLLVFLETSFFSPWYNEWFLYWHLSRIRSKRIGCEVLHLYFSIYTYLLWHIVLKISIDILKCQSVIDKFRCIFRRLYPH